jgi:tetratricopeptide (TPR) repeat protein
MKKLLLACCLLNIGFVQAQRILTTPPSGGNKKAMVGEQIGLTTVTIRYDRPAVKGREGKIWGQLVQPGFFDQGFGNTTAAPWRAGANETTIIEFDKDVTIEGKPLKAGSYGFYIAYGAEQSTLIFSHDNQSWGSYYYDPRKDALRVTVKPVATNQSTEWLRYDFSNQTESAATVSLLWDKLAIPFRVETDLIQQQLDLYRRELRTDKGFYWSPWQQAAQWCLDKNVNLEEALQWADTSVNAALGDRNFATLSTRARILEKLGRTAEAAAGMKDALNMGNMNQIHQYARQLLQQKKNNEALEIFKLNLQKNPGQFTTLLGMARGYSAVGDYKKALEMAEKALPLAPAGANKTFVERAVALLKEGKDIN